jgi:hypothetical protein
MRKIETGSEQFRRMVQELLDLSGGQFDQSCRPNSGSSQCADEGSENSVLFADQKRFFLHFQ